jgi:diguanylate cyclase (GGDEF)-like protein
MPIAASAAAVAAVLLALAGAALGPVAVLLALPAGAVAALVQRRVEVRERRLVLLSQRDALTGLGNRRVLEQRLGYEITRHRRHRRRFCVVAMDLDGFKQVNDRFGHQAGDEVLREVARALERSVRDQDTVVRLGGDEFCILAPESGPAEAESLAARVRWAVAGAVDGLESLAVSAGYAIYPDDGEHGDELLARADEAAIAAKRRRTGGRATSRRAA